MDGGYTNTLEDRVAAADTVIFLDLGRALCMWRIAKRTASTFGRVRADLAPGCPELFDPKFLAYVWRFQRDQRPRVLAILDTAPTTCSVVTLRSPHDCDTYLVSRRAETKAG